MYYATTTTTNETQDWQETSYWIYLRANIGGDNDKGIKYFYQKIYCMGQFTMVA